jgi:DNA primase
MNLEEVKSSLDIVEIVSKYVKLKRSGSYYSGLCPFHKETKPSFYVSPERQIFKCFGCGEGGDVLKFLMKIENLNFSQLIDKLKSEYGFSELYNQENKLDKNKIRKYLEINYSALKFFRLRLKENLDVCNYLKSRGLSEKTLDFFEIGFSPGGTLLRDYLYSIGYSFDEIKEIGLVDAQNFDRFKSRIIFPLRDENGRLVGFTGRAFPNNAMGVKYLNSPDSLIFKKSKFLYGLYYAKEYILNLKKIILTEGQFDFLLSWQNNFKNVAAISGVALTQDHLLKIKKLCDKIIFAFDNDEAGFKASLRSNLLAKKLGFNTYKLVYQGKDLAEYFLLYSSNLNVYEEKFENWLIKEVFNFYQDKKEALKILLSQVRFLDALELNEYLEKISDLFKISKTLLEKELHALKDQDSFEFEDFLVKEKEIVEEKSLEDKFSLKLISLIYSLNLDSLKIDEFLDYLNDDFKNLLIRIIKRELTDKEYDYLEMSKSFYLTNKIDFDKEIKKVLKNLKIIYFKKTLKKLTDELKSAKDDESQQIIEKIKQVNKQLKITIKN